MLKIADLNIKYPVVPAPLASLTDIVFRKLLDEIGYTGYMVTEMISAEGLRRRQTKTLDMIRHTQFNTPQFIQLFGSSPDPFIEAVRFIENETPYQGIDINMGCPAHKVVRKGGGSALLKDPAHAGLILKETKKHTRLPVTVKIRLGFQKENVMETVKILEAEGADAITVHFRLQTEGYRTPAHWDYAPIIKDHLNPTTPLIGNGDITTAAQAREKLRLMDGIMIGRGAVANPLIFAQIAAQTQTSPTTIPTMGHVYQRLLELIREYYPPHFRLPRLKAYTRFLFSHKEHARKIRHKIYTAPHFEEAAQHFLACASNENHTIDIDNNNR